MTPRHRWIALTLALLVVANIVWYIYGRWGLITVQVDHKPLAQVIHSIEKQGGVTIRTDLPGETLVSMHVHLVTLREALETISTITESRWQLAYVFGPDKGQVAALLGTVVTGQRPEGWKTAFYPIRGVPELAEANLPADPRQDLWNVKDPGQKTAQAVLDQGARSVSAAFVFPETWDPAVASLPSSGVVSRVAPKVAKLAGGAEQEVVLLLRGQQQGEVAGFEDDGERFRGGRNWLSGGRRGGPGAGPGGFTAMEDRARAEVEKLPPEARKIALAELDERKKFFEALRDLPADERRAKMEEYMSQPSVQDQQDQSKLARESRMTPQQKQQRAQKYEQRRENYLANGSTGGGGNAKR